MTTDRTRKGYTMDQIEVRKRFSVTKLEVEPATEDGPEGVFTAHVSAFGVLDSQGDVVDKGAYAGSVAKFKDGGKILLYWMHDYTNIMSLIGELTAIEETDTDLLVAGALDVADNPVAAKVFHHMQLGRLKEFSVGGMVDDWSIEGTDSDAVVHIKNLDLWEVSVCFKGANPATELLSLKSHVMKQAPAPLDLPDVEHDYTPGPARLTNSTQALLGLLPLV